MTLKLVPESKSGSSISQKQKPVANAYPNIIQKSTHAIPNLIQKKRNCYPNTDQKKMYCSPTVSQNFGWKRDVKTLKIFSKNHLITSQKKFQTAATAVKIQLNIEPIPSKIEVKKLATGPPRISAITSQKPFHRYSVKVNPSLNIIKMTQSTDAMGNPTIVYIVRNPIVLRVIYIMEGPVTIK